MRKLIPFFILISGAVSAQSAAADEAAIARGEYIFNAAGCAGCHTNVKQEGALLAGGRPLDTPFGRFYGPNITPDPEHGIGRWSDEDFLKALQTGISPDGKPYYPAFPFTSFSKATKEDLLDLKAYIFSLPAVAEPSLEHELRFPFSFRPLLWGWRLLSFRPEPYIADPAAAADAERGRYLVDALTHCGECHTPRNQLGALDNSMYMAGTLDGPEGQSVPNITPHGDTGIGAWSEDEIVTVLQTGLTPEFDSVGAAMGEVVAQSTGKLTDDDLKAIASYLKSIPEIDNLVAKPETN